MYPIPRSSLFLIDTNKPMTDSSLSGRLANFLSSAFLALALLVAAGFAVHSMSMTEATAKADMNTDIVATDDLEIEGNDVLPPPSAVASILTATKRS